MAKKQRKCANSDCNCDAEEGSKYCSTRCEEMGGLTVTKCPCGHAGLHSHCDRRGNTDGRPVVCSHKAASPVRVQHRVAVRCPEQALAMRRIRLEVNHHAIIAFA